MKRLIGISSALFAILICFPYAHVLAEDEGDQAEENLDLTVGLLVRETKIKEYVGKLGDLRLALVQAKFYKDHEDQAIAAAQIADLEIALIELETRI